MTRPPLPPFTDATAAEKVRLAEDAWNSHGPARVAVDCEYCSWDDAIGPMAQELAVLPPVSGG